MGENNTSIFPPFMFSVFLLWCTAACCSYTTSLLCSERELIRAPHEGALSSHEHSFHRALLLARLYRFCWNLSERYSGRKRGGISRLLLTMKLVLNWVATNCLTVDRKKMIFLGRTFRPARKPPRRHTSHLSFPPLSSPESANSTAPSQHGPVQHQTLRALYPGMFVVRVGRPLWWIRHDHVSILLLPCCPKRGHAHTF